VEVVVWGAIEIGCVLAGGSVVLGSKLEMGDRVLVGKFFPNFFF
jgi:hypothetical protein